VNDTIAWLALGLSLLWPVAVFAGRNWLKVRIERGVQHNFDVKMEGLRTELRENEERTKSRLRDREAEISALRGAVLTGSAGRQSLLDKRRFEAVEKIWTAVNDFAHLRLLSEMMAHLDFKQMSNELDHPSMRQFVGVLEKTAPSIDQMKKNVARDEQPFVTEIAWAYFLAYKSILMGSYLRLQTLKAGVKDADKYMKKDPTKKILLAALPHQAEFIEQNDPEMYHFLLEEIEGNLLIELRKILDGVDADQVSIQRSKNIIKAVKDVDRERAEYPQA
jgi:hypothetical protein